MTIKSFYDLRSWQEAKDLAVIIYQVTSNFPDTEKYGLISQLRRASVSVPSNIAEGMGRSGTKDLIRFIVNARGSVYEILSQLEISKELQFIEDNDYKLLIKRYNGLAAGINTHINRLKLRGTKPLNH